ncbi:MAG: ribosome silencing factor [Calditrichaeota bacterium]|nr:ribosome silencing factor [Calditrichota bacterium]
MTSQELSDKISRLAWEKKGQDILILDLRHLTDITDYFVIISGESDLHVKAIADHIETELEKEHIKMWHKEGYEHLNWVLLDYVDVVVHIFRPEVRTYYALEKLWADAKITRVEDNVTSDRIIP